MSERSFYTEEIQILNDAIDSFGTVPIHRIECTDGILILANPIYVRVEKEDGRIYISSEEPPLCGMGMSIEESYRDFPGAFLSEYDYYREKHPETENCGVLE